jgi:hypothetical protein
MRRPGTEPRLFHALTTIRAAAALLLLPLWWDSKHRVK